MNYNLTKKKTSIGVVFLFLITAVVSCTPILSSKAMFLAIPILLLCIYILINWGTIFSNRNYLLATNTLLFLILIILYRMIGYSDANIGRYFLKFLFFLPILGMLTFVNIHDKIKKRIWWLIVIVATANIAYNIFLGIKYPSINTAEVQDLMEESVLDNLNLGRSPFYTFSLFFANVCLFVFLNCKEKLEKYAMLVCFLIASLYICWFCYKASVVVFFLLSTFLLFLAKRTRQTTKFIIISSVVSVLVFLFSSIFSEEIIQTLISISPNERLTGRLVALIDAQNSEAFDGTLQGRENLVMLSVETWLSGPVNFLFGIGDHFSTEGNAAATGIGQHAELIDTLAQYGIFGFSFLIVVYRKVLQYITVMFRPEHKAQIFVIFLIWALCGFAKYIFLPGIACALFMLLPLSSLYLKK